MAREAQLWRHRLREAINRTGKKHSSIAAEAGITPETLSRILTGHHARVSFDLVVRVTHVVGQTVGWLLEEEDFRLNTQERKVLLSAAEIIMRNERWGLQPGDEERLLRFFGGLPE